ncbi:hypothetical protein GLAREA_02053 [Glarea lozoyensis ATCC 20868]|uniref:Uncharacterized protein n=1 Tax=Glarea lozoyensis (strain ATCC 20868 / MF5171) TaxID=1116229 RepID=S3D262_GLAL2|nr:uncharacterized protein GLAREA_02053 [Glarea lozoyensis ATCC 20868]EPE26141.1 hypothetical protein GLAREA_02053 [Glarea lozoyensis ATCC 20868]
MGSLPAVVQRPAVYNNGYGDFIFNTRMRRSQTQAQVLPIRHSKELGNKVVPSLDNVKSLNTKRTDAFEFFKLPLEIRKRIYEMLLGPLWVRNDSQDKWRIPLNVIRKQGSAENRFPFSPHPEFNTSYCWDCITSDTWIDPFKTSDTPPGEAYFNWLRRISHTSCSFRQEFAEVFWCRTSLTLESYGHNFLHLENVLRDRPSISRGIKYLYIAMEYMLEDIEGKVDTDGFIQQLRRLSLFLSLEKLMIVLGAPESALDELALGEGKYKVLNGIREFNVSKEFTIWLYIDPTISDSMTKSEKEFRDSDNYLSPLTIKYERILENRFSPVSLHPAELSEEEKYLKERAKGF